MVDQEIINKYYSGTLSDCQLFEKIVLDYIKEDMVVLDAGAGSGAEHNGAVIQRKANKVIGVDIDEVVLKNPHLDLNIQAPLDSIPLPEQSVDMIYSRYVFEHLDKPEAVVSEFYRVLKSDGIIVILTPNKNHYVSLLSRITPHCFHEWINNKRGRNEEDTFPTYYRCNTAKEMKNVFYNSGFITEQVLLHEGVPNYLLWNKGTFYCGLAYERLVNSNDMFSNMRITILGIFRKKIEL